MTIGYAVQRATPPAGVTYGEPTIDQHTIGQWRITWNPDDCRFYVADNDQGAARATFRRLANAIQWAKKQG